MNRHSRQASAARQLGLTLIEFMISIVLGMILVAAISVLIANQSTARSEIDRGGRLIENGRYAMQVIADDIMMAGYWGESSAAPVTGTVSGAPAAPAASVLPNPCTTTVTSADGANPGIQESSTFYIQGYDNSTYTSGTLSCVPNWKSGTDIVVIRHADPDTTGIAVASLTPGQVYLQTGLTSATATSFNYRFYSGGSGSDTTNFPLVNKSGVLQAPRKWLVRIYYIASCSVCSGGSADTIPTLKRTELTVTSGSPAMTSTPTTIAEGIENMQVDYGLVTASTDTPASSVSLAQWTDDVVTARVYLLVRSTDTSPGYTNSKKFVMGASYPTASPFDPGADGYQRHLFQQVVRLVNPSGRKSS